MNDLDGVSTEEVVKLWKAASENYKKSLLEAEEVFFRISRYYKELDSLTKELEARGVDSPE